MDIKHLIQCVNDFHEAFNVDGLSRPGKIPQFSKKLRSELAKEEIEEYLEAEEMTEIADALGDQLYILLGTIAVHGLQDKIVDIFLAIHRSNMSKLGEDGAPLINGVNVHDSTKPLGKLLKGPNYYPPTEAIKEILK